MCLLGRNFYNSVAKILKSEEVYQIDKLTSFLNIYSPRLTQVEAGSQNLKVADTKTYFRDSFSLNKAIFYYLICQQSIN